MSLKLALLKNVKHRPGKIVAQCPACAEVGGDSKGIHLVLYPDGKFGCTANPKDKAHRRRIAQLVGCPERQVRPWTLNLNSSAVLTGVQCPTMVGIPITSLSRNNVKGLKKSNNTPSETSATTFPDKTDACKHSTHRTAKTDQVRTAVYIRPPRQPSEVSENGLASKASEASEVSSAAANPSEVSDDAVTKAVALFEGKIVAVIQRDDIVPDGFRDVLATWATTHNHPSLQSYIPKRLCGWTRRGSPIYRKS